MQIVAGYHSDENLLHIQMQTLESMERVVLLILGMWLWLTVRSQILFEKLLKPVKEQTGANGRLWETSIQTTTLYFVN